MCHRATLPMEGDKCLQQISFDFLYTPLSQCPLPSLQGLEFELQTSPANLFLSHNVLFLPPRTPQPLFSTPPKTVHGESRPCPFHPSKAINGDATTHSLLAAQRKARSTQKSPVGSVTEGYFRSQGIKLMFLRRKVPAFSGCDMGIKQSHQLLTIYMMENHRKDWLSLKPPN